MTGFVGEPLPPSLYAVTARAPVETRPLEGDRKAAVAVVGAGFTGLSVALHLAEQGVETLVLDAREPGWGASGRNGGQVNPGLKHDPDEVEQDFGAELGQRMNAFSWGAPDTLFALIRKHGLDCEPRQGGTLRLARSEARLAQLRVTHEQCRRRGIPVELLDRAGVRAATGSDRYLGALLAPRGGDVNPLGLARGLAEAAQKAGATICSDSPARLMEKRGSAWRIATPRGSVLADKVLLATNGYSDGLWPGLARSVVPVRSAIAATEPLPAELAGRIMPTRSVAYEIDHITVYYRIDQGNRLLMGGRSGLAPVTQPADVPFLTHYASVLWPELGKPQWTHAWNGNVALTEDHYPHLHEPAENLMICLGYNGRGVALSTSLGTELARRIVGGRSADIPMPITPLKPMTFHRFWPVGVTFAVAKGRLLDRLGL